MPILLSWLRSLKTRCHPLLAKRQGRTAPRSPKRAGRRLEIDYLEARVVPAAVVLSDTFNRANATQYFLGEADLGLGGTGAHFYVPIFAAGANIASNTLQNSGLDYGGVQFTTTANTMGTRGTSVGQDLDISVNLLVPTDAAHDVSEAGVYFRSRAAYTNDGIIGGQAFDPSGGYWVRLLSNGKIEVVDLRTNVVTATTSTPTSFNNTIFHQLQIAVQGSGLQVSLDGVLTSFSQNGGAP